MRKKKKSGTRVLITFLIILIIVSGAYLAWKIVNDKKEAGVESFNEEAQEQGQVVEENKVKIYSGKDRPIAVMIDNHNLAWPQAGLNDAYMVYEIVVEGGETRLMALFKGKDIEKIGPVRSSRHYFLDYAMENDAIYVHFGWSPQAQSDISKYKINNINGISEDGTTFWRVKDKSAPHNAVTSTKKIMESAKSKKYRTTSTSSSVLNYVTDEILLEDGIEANEVTIPHSQLQTVKYEYDSEQKVYERYARNKEQKDWTTGNMVTTKNIIITFCDNYELTDSENKGRQGLKNTGTFDGYYITNGKAIKIKCIKESRNEKTKYEDLEGNEIKVNDGNTYVQICPINAKVTIEGKGKFKDLAICNGTKTSVEIPNTVTSIGKLVFCRNKLTNSTITFPTTPLTIDCNAFDSNLEELIYPSNVTIVYSKN